jgi:hypothetical protein
MSERIKVLTDREQSGALLGLPSTPVMGTATWVAHGIYLEIQQYAKQSFLLLGND